MTKDISMAIDRLDTPKSINVKSFEQILQENIKEAKGVLGKDWYPLEADPYMRFIRVLTLRQLHNQADKNNTILSQLATTAIKTDLDSIGIDRGVIRNQGGYPYAQFKFSLAAPSDGTILISKGTRISSLQNSQFYAEIINDITVPVGQHSVIAPGVLNVIGKEHDIVLDTLVTDIPYISSVNQITSFSGGSDTEKDNRYRLRIILSRLIYNTAGCIDAYIYHSFSADPRIDDVELDSPQALEINIYIASNSGVDDVMIDRVYKALNNRDTRPVSDKVSVYEAKKINVALDATIELYDLVDKERIENEIQDNLDIGFFIGQSFIRSDFIGRCHIDGVYRVTSNFNDVIVDKTQIIKIGAISLDFKKAVL